jgi:hypothetical protein
MGGKFPAGREFFFAAWPKAVQMLGKRTIPASRAGNFFTGLQGIIFH